MRYAPYTDMLQTHDFTEVEDKVHQKQKNLLHKLYQYAIITSVDRMGL